MSIESGVSVQRLDSRAATKTHYPQNMFRKSVSNCIIISYRVYVHMYSRVILKNYPAIYIAIYSKDGQAASFGVGKGSVSEKFNWRLETIQSTLLKT